MPTIYWAVLKFNYIINRFQITKIVFVFWFRIYKVPSTHVFRRGPTTHGDRQPQSVVLVVHPVNFRTATAEFSTSDTEYSRYRGNGQLRRMSSLSRRARHPVDIPRTRILVLDVKLSYDEKWDSLVAMRLHFKKQLWDSEVKCKM